MSIRAGAGLILLLSFALWTGMRLVRDVARRGPDARKQEILQDWNEHRLARMRSALPPRGVVGFASGGPHGEKTERYLLQYVLAPIVVVPEHDRDLVIGTFDPATGPPPPSPRHEVLLEDREHGLICWKVK